MHNAMADPTPWSFEHRDPGPHVLIDIHSCELCHTDIHQARNEWGNAVYRWFPGHEIVGIAVTLLP